MDNRFTVRRLPNGVTEISDPSQVHSFLVEGAERAVLIDTMVGLRGLKDLVSTLTELPVEVVLTHGHMDHAGGVYEFGACRIHPEDVPMLDGKTLSSRMGYMNGQFQAMGEPCPFSEEEFLPDCPVECTPLQGGDKLDLGGRVLKVLHVPGHTKGSLCYLDPVTGDFFAGDACNNNTLVMMDTSATISQYLEALLALKERQGEIQQFYLFHGPSLQDKSCIDDNIQCCREILAGTDDHVPVEFLGRQGYLAKERNPGTFDRKDGRFGNIMYTPNLVK